MKNKKIKLMIVTPYFHPKIGGLENYAYNIAKGLKNNYNYKIVVITSNHKDKIYKEETIGGMKIYRLPYQFKISNTPISFKWKKEIKKIIEKEKPDVINAHTPVSSVSDVTARVCGDVPFMLTYHVGSMKKNKFLLDIIIWIYEHILIKKMLKKAKKIICSSDFVRLDFLKYYSDKTITITPGVDIDKFKPIKNNTKKTLLFVGTLNKSESYKSLDILIKSLKEVKRKFEDIKLIIIGEGDNKNEYKDLAKKLRLEKNVYFLGKLYDAKLVKQYQQSNILILPSVNDSFGMVLIEAMACKKPVIGSKIGGIPYVIDNNKNGLLVPPKDPKALADAIIKILKNPKLAKQMGENGYKKVKENFTWDKKIKETNKLLNKVVKK